MRTTLEYHESNTKGREIKSWTSKINKIDPKIVCTGFGFELYQNTLILTGEHKNEK